MSARFDVKNILKLVNLVELMLRLIVTQAKLSSHIRPSSHYLTFEIKCKAVGIASCYFNNSFGSECLN